MPPAESILMAIVSRVEANAMLDTLGQPLRPLAAPFTVAHVWRRLARPILLGLTSKMDVIAKLATQDQVQAAQATHTTIPSQAAPVYRPSRLGR